MLAPLWLWLSCSVARKLISNFSTRVAQGPGNLEGLRARPRGVSRHKAVTVRLTPAAQQVSDRSLQKSTPEARAEGTESTLFVGAQCHFPISRDGRASRMLRDGHGASRRRPGASKKHPKLRAAVKQPRNATSRLSASHAAARNGRSRRVVNHPSPQAHRGTSTAETKRRWGGL